MVGCWPSGVLCVFSLLVLIKRPGCVVVAVTISLHDLVVSFFAMNRWGVCIFVCSVSVYKFHPLIFENVCRENAEMHGGWETTMETNVSPFHCRMAIRCRCGTEGTIQGERQFRGSQEGRSHRPWMHWRRQCGSGHLG